MKERSNRATIHHMPENDQELVRRLNSRDKEAFTIIYYTYSKRLFYHALKFVKSAEIAEDAVQEVFVKLWDSAGSLDIRYSLQAYLFRVMQNYILNLVKRGALEVRIITTLNLPEEPGARSTEDLISLKETASEAQRAIDELPPQRKLIFELSRNEDLSHREIADRLNIADSTVNNQLVKAIKFIRNRLIIRGAFILVGIQAVLANLFF